MVVDRSSRRCLLCETGFTGRAFVCRTCAERYREGPIPDEVLRQFYTQVDIEYPEWANTYGNYNPPRALLKYLKELDRDLSILELGAGGGFLLEELWNAGFRNLTGSDITTSALEEMRGRTGDIQVVGANAESIPFRASSFDVVITSDVIEHLVRVERHVEDVSRVLRPGGSYLLKTPSRRPAELYYRTRGLYDHHIWHPSMFSPGEVRTAFGAHGFDVRFLPVSELTAAQVRKVPTSIGKRLIRRFPIDRLPVWLHPHMEIVATRRT
jgi:SAM-dependent methyltransferase